MSAPSLAEAITTSFYAWELRGRGWQLADYPVSLEPVFRPFFLLPYSLRPTQALDDGKRPTFISQLIERTRRFWANAPNTIQTVEAFEEEEPFPAFASGPLVTLHLQVEPTFVSNAEVMGHLLRALSASLQPVSFELIGQSGIVSMQIVCTQADRDHVFDSIEGYAPDAVVIEGDDLLADNWRDEQEALIVDFGLAHEFFLPLSTLQNFRVDPYISLVAALKKAKREETLCVQILFERVRNPWERAIVDAVGDGEGGSLFADAPEFLALAKEKVASPLFAVAVRVAAHSVTADRRWELVRGINAFILQFKRPGGNELIPLENDGYASQSHSAALLSRQSFRTGMVLSADELIGLIHLPDVSVRHEALVRPRKRTKALPEDAKGHSLLLGENEHRGIRTPATVGDEARLAHTHIIGASGTGKSTLILNLIMQDIEHGLGVAVLDPHGDLIDEICARVPEHRVNDIVLFDPGDEEWPLGFNMLSAKTESEKRLLSSDLVSVFQRLSTSWGDTMSAVLGNAVLAVLERDSGGTLLDLRRFLVDGKFRSEFLRKVADEDIHFFWEAEFPLIGARSIGPILTRLDAFLRSKLIRNIVGQRHPRYDLAEVMESGKVFLGKLSQGLIGEENAHLLGSLLVSKLHQLALARQELALSARTPFFLFADEFQHFVTPSIAALLAEGRKYRLGLILAHQTLAQLKREPQVESALLGNAYTRIAFRTAHEDAKALEKEYAFFEANDLQGLSRGSAIARLGSASNDFNLTVRPLPDIQETIAAARRSAVIAHSRAAFGSPVAEIKTQLAQLFAREEKHTKAGKSPGHDGELAISIPEREVPELVEKEERKQSKASTRKAVAPEPAPLGRGGQEHKYLQHLVKRLGEERGFRAVIEEPVAGGRVDVVLRKDTLAIACEISVTTEAGHEIENLKKCMAGGYSHVLIVSADKRRREKLTKRLHEVVELVSVEVVGPEEVVSVLERLTPLHSPAESTVRGYKVKVTRQALSHEELSGKRSAIAEVIARSLRKA